MQGLGGQLQDAIEKALLMVTEASTYNELSAASKAADALLRGHRAQEVVSLSVAHDGAKPAEVKHSGKLGLVLAHMDYQTVDAEVVHPALPEDTDHDD